MKQHCGESSPFDQAIQRALHWHLAHSTPPWLCKDTFTTSLTLSHTGSLYLPPARDFPTMSSSDESQEDMMDDG